MNSLARVALVDERSSASNPGKLSVDPLRFAKHFPAWPSLFAAALVAAIACAVLKPVFWAAAAFFLALNVLFWVRTRLRFRHGCVNPAIVVCESPLTLAVYTDLTTGAGEYPVIKIMHHPRPQGTSVTMGAKFATVALYSGTRTVEHWENFHPILVECATSDRLTIERTFYSIPDEEWRRFKSGLKDLPQPLKPGLYPVKATPAAQS